MHLSSVVFPFSSPGVCFSFLSLLLAPVCCVFSLLCCTFFAAVALPCASSGFPVSLLACSVFHIHWVLYSFHCFLCFRLGVLFFLTCWAPLARVQVFLFACWLLRCFLPPVAVLFWLLASPFSFFFFLVICLFSCGSASIPQRFSCLSLVCFLGQCVVTCDSFSSSPFGSFALAWGFAVFLAVHLLRSAFFLFSFVFLGLDCGVSFLAFFPLAAYVA